MFDPRNDVVEVEPKLADLWEEAALAATVAGHVTNNRQQRKADARWRRREEVEQRVRVEELRQRRRVEEMQERLRRQVVDHRRRREELEQQLRAEAAAA